ncbi:hypothetical protein PIB30_073739 [Stylosanthes scabra]|uniref:Uncharacterized protein n=1 Tax=Stylosanthes scabra TaxID=79078 RepID=A0ABU6URR3_9FABA|nr:hypothetical protein [Stylosanthes scabra]
MSRTQRPLWQQAIFASPSVAYATNAMQQAPFRRLHLLRAQHLLLREQLAPNPPFMFLNAQKPFPNVHFIISSLAQLHSHSFSHLHTIGTHQLPSSIFIIIINLHHHHQMASKGKAPEKAPSTRVCGLTSQQQPLLEIQLYETPTHAERTKTLEERRVIHERTIKFPKGKDTFEE